MDLTYLPPGAAKLLTPLSEWIFTGLHPTPAGKAHIQSETTVSIETQTLEDLDPSHCSLRPKPTCFTVTGSKSSCLCRFSVIQVIVTHHHSSTAVALSLTGTETVT